MSDYVGSPTDEMVDGMAKATIYEPDHELPEFVDSGSEIGSSVSVTGMNSNQVDGVLFDNAMQTIDTLKQEIATLKQQVAPVVYSAKVEKVKEWSSKIVPTHKFDVGPYSAFAPGPSRFTYIRLLIKCFYSHPDFVNWTFENQLFDPTNGYANFQHLLNKCPVPSDLYGFYKNDMKKAHLVSNYLSSP